MTQEIIDATRAPAYISFRTFYNFIAWAREEGGLPSQMDRTFWGTKFSGLTGTQLLGALKFLRLITDDLRPTSELNRMLGSDEEAKILLAERIKEAYAVVLNELDGTASYKQFRDAFTKLSATGSTLRKAESFFIHAAKWSGVPVSSWILKKARGSSTAKQNGQTKKPRKAKGEILPPPAPLSPHHRDHIQHADFDASSSMLILGLFKRLPKQYDIFDKDDREAWIAAARSVFDLEYKQSPKKDQ